MNRPERCPGCCSKYPNIRGSVYPEGSNWADCKRCENTWHYEGYPDILILNMDDRALLRGFLISLD